MDRRFKYLVAKYLDNELDVAEKKELADFLRDPAYMAYLRKEEKAEKVIRIGLRNMLKKDALPDQFDKEMDEIPEEIKEDVRLYGGKADPAVREQVKRMHEQMIRRRKIRLVVKYASAAFLVVSLYFLWTDYLVPIPQSVFRAYYKHYAFAEISPATIPDERIRSAMSMYEKGDYAGSAGICRGIIASGTTEGDIHFLYGLNLMALDSMERAIKEFDVQISSYPIKDTTTRPPVYWYKGLCYLQLNKPVAALREIGKPYYRKLKEKMGL
jgi:hypothetical protein